MKKIMNKIMKKMGLLLSTAVLIASIFPAVALADVTSVPDQNTERRLNIYKYTPANPTGTEGNGLEDNTVGDTREPLQGVEFEIYRVPDTDAIAETPDEDQVSAIAIPGNKVTTVVTDADGMATYSFGNGPANDGTYLIVELDSPAVEAPTAPFYVSMPMTSPDEEFWLYTVNVYPKSDVTTGPGVNKDVNELENDSATTDIGVEHTWIIRGDVPSDLYRTAAGPVDVYAKEYAFTDDLDPALTYTGSLMVKLYTQEGKELTLDNNIHYNTTGTTADNNGGGVVKVALTQEGMKYVMQYLGVGTNTPEIRVYFNTVINDTALLNTKIENDVTLDFTNSANNKYDPVTVPVDEIPEVHMGGLSIDKYKKGDAATKLAAVFQIAREATPDEIADNVIQKQTIRVNGNDLTVVYVEFYDNDSIDGNKANQVTTNASTGKAVINGLAYGDYYLIETKAPEGYNLLSAPIAVSVNETSHEAANVVKVENNNKFTLPITGGAGTIFLTVGGVILIGIAILLIVLSRRKKQKHDE